MTFYSVIIKFHRAKACWWEQKSFKKRKKWLTQNKRCDNITTLRQTKQHKEIQNLDNYTVMQP